MDSTVLELLCRIFANFKESGCVQNDTKTQTFF